MITGCSPSLNAKTQEISGSFFKCETEIIIFFSRRNKFHLKKKMIASFTHGKKVSLGYITPYTDICFHRWKKNWTSNDIFFFQPIQFRSDLENGSHFHRLTLNRKVFLRSFASVKNSEMCETKWKKMSFLAQKKHKNTRYIYSVLAEYVTLMLCLSLGEECVIISATCGQYKYYKN